MKKILIVMGSGHIKGTTHLLAQHFAQGAVTAGHQVQTVALNGEILGCQGCEYCQNHQHQCIIQDKMQEIYPLFQQADIVVLASPLYFWSISGRLKSFIDRLYALSTNDEYPPKETVLLMCGGSSSFYAFEQSVSFYRFFTQALGWQRRGMVLAGGCSQKDNQPYIEERYLKEAYQLGQSL